MTGDAGPDPAPGETEAGFSFQSSPTERWGDGVWGQKAPDVCATRKGKPNSRVVGQTRPPRCPGPDPRTPRVCHPCEGTCRQDSVKGLPLGTGPRSSRGPQGTADPGKRRPLPLRSERRAVSRTAPAGLALKTEEGASGQGMWAASSRWKRPGTDAPPEPRRGMRPIPRLELRGTRVGLLTSGPGRDNPCGSKPPSLGQFVTAAKGGRHRWAQQRGSCAPVTPSWPHRERAPGAGRCGGLPGAALEAWREKEASGGSPLQAVPPRPGRVTSLCPGFLVCKMGTDPSSADSSQATRARAQEGGTCTHRFWLVSGQVFA